MDINLRAHDVLREENCLRLHCHSSEGIPVGLTGSLELYGTRNGHFPSVVQAYGV